jgi:large subunit ribosomal protein L11
MDSYASNVRLFKQRLHFNKINTNKLAQGDRSYSLEIFKPPVGFLLKQAAGISRASMEPGHKVAGVISLKHIYEIAKFKITDKNCAHMDLKQMCIKVINTANRAGIKIIKHDLDPAELKEFLDARKQIEDNELKLLTEKKAAKMMRAPATPVAATTAKK